LTEKDASTKASISKNVETGTAYSLETTDFWVKMEASVCGKPRIVRHMDRRGRNAAFLLRTVAGIESGSQRQKKKREFQARCSADET